MMLILTACIGAVVLADGSDAAEPVVTHSVSGKSVIATGGSSEYKILFTEATATETIEITYTAALKKDGNTVTSGVSPSSGSLTNGEATTLTVASQKTAGDYKLEITYKETVKFSGDTESTTLNYTDSYSIKIMEPIALKVNLKNTGSIDLYKGTVVFYLDGKKIDDSETEVTVAAGSTETVTYNYLPDKLSSGSHTYYVEAADGSPITGLGADHKTTFYYNQSDYKYLDYIAIAFVVVLLILLAWVLTKPVKNRGKPKSRKD